MLFWLPLQTDRRLSGRLHKLAFITILMMAPKLPHKHTQTHPSSAGRHAYPRMWLCAPHCPSPHRPSPHHPLSPCPSKPTADTVVLVVGTDLNWAAEGHDAKNISFTDAQDALISKVSAAAKKPVIVVLLTATPLDISSLLTNPKVGAILHAGQPSVTTLGVGDLLFGKKVPAGRMVQTIYPAAYQEQISIFDFGMRPGPSTEYGFVFFFFLFVFVSFFVFVFVFVFFFFFFFFFLMTSRRTDDVVVD